MNIANVLRTAFFTEHLRFLNLLTFFVFAFGGICLYFSSAVSGQTQKQSVAYVLKNRCTEKFRCFLAKYYFFLQFYQKEIPTQLFSCEICEILRPCFSTEHLRWLLRQIAVRNDKQQHCTTYSNLYKHFCF